MASAVLLMSQGFTLIAPAPSDCAAPAQSTERETHQRSESDPRGMTIFERFGSEDELVTLRHATQTQRAQHMIQRDAERQQKRKQDKNATGEGRTSELAENEHARLVICTKSKPNEPDETDCAATDRDDSTGDNTHSGWRKRGRARQRSQGNPPKPNQKAETGCWRRINQTHLAGR